MRRVRLVLFLVEGVVLIEDLIAKLLNYTSVIELTKGVEAKRTYFKVKIKLHE